MRRLIGKGEFAGIVGFNQGHRHRIQDMEHAAFQLINLAIGLVQKALEFAHLEDVDDGNYAGHDRQYQQDCARDAQDGHKIRIVLNHQATPTLRPYNRSNGPRSPNPDLFRPSFVR